MTRSINLLRASRADGAASVSSVVNLANSAPADDSNQVCLCNEGTLAETAITIPYGEYPHKNGLQVLTRAVAERMVANWSGWRQKLARAFGGVPIYIGHPDFNPKEWPDTRAYGWIKSIAATNEGLVLTPEWSPAGLQLLENAHYKWPSPFWGCVPAGTRPGQSLPIVEPTMLRSVGLTNTPNIPGIAPLANEQEQKGNEMKKLLELLGLAPEATEDDACGAISKMQADLKAAQEATAAQATAQATENSARLAAQTAADTALANAKTAHETELANAKAELATVQTALANERTAKIGLALANAIGAGRITLAQRAEWEGKLAADFETNTKALANNAPALKTTTITNDLGKRASEETQRTNQVLSLVNERRAKFPGEAYEDSFANVKKDNPALFAAMKQPSGK